MAWTAPMTFTDGSVLTAAQLNTHLRDNLLETAVAKATTASRIFVATGANQIAERGLGVNQITTNETTTSTSYTDLASAGPTVSVTSGTRCLVFINARMWASANANVFASYEVSGATSLSANDTVGVSVRVVTGGDTNPGQMVGRSVFQSSLTAGSNTFTMKYKTSAGTANFQDRHLWVIPL